MIVSVILCELLLVNLVFFHISCMLVSYDKNLSNFSVVSAYFSLGPKISKILMPLGNLAIKFFKFW